MMHASKISAVPEVDTEFRLVGLHTLSQITGAPEIPNITVIMAGGKGTRLGELTRHTPKPLMPVAGRPIIEWIILGLVGDGIRTVYVTVNHMADQIIERLGDGEQLGCHIEYLREQVDNPLGTAGALSLLPESVTEPGNPPMLVINGDLMVDFDAQALINRHGATGAAVTMGTRPYSHTVPFGVVEVDDDRHITAITEKPTVTVEINTAIYCIDADLPRLLPYNQPSTMPDLAQSCLDQGRRVIAWPLSSEWIDIGTPTDLARAKGHS
jgi:NDP-sugar pyrophosphorylase family protein